MITFALLNRNIKQSIMQEPSVATRLKLFIESKEITITQFADKCGIPRPTLSQLLSGRNKKLSDVIVKLIHDTYPELSVLWLMFGEGDMILPAPINPTLVSEAEKFMEDIAENDENSNLRDLNKLNGKPNSVVKQSIIHADADVNSRLKIEQIHKKERKVVSITVFYDDNSYETFTPAAK